MSDEEREEMLLEDELVCKDCGNLRSVCSDPNVPWYPQKVICYATAVRDMRLRKVQKKFEKAKPGPGGLLPLDGVGVWMAQENLQPGETFFD